MEAVRYAIQHLDFVSIFEALKYFALASIFGLFILWTLYYLVVGVWVAYNPIIIAIALFTVYQYRDTLRRVVKLLEQTVVGMYRILSTDEIRQLAPSPTTEAMLILAAPVLLWMLYRNLKVEGWPHNKVEVEYVTGQPLPAWEAQDNMESMGNMDHIQPYFDQVERTVLERGRYMLDGVIYRLNDFRFGLREPYEPSFW
ncbi:hypothetical protein F5Y02DRAFT_413222 [Annulohypoxylon stygium]|nr:hypothetical protein F5Y02DRAFT_413222 [Annulohypoxylon stygium]